MWYTSGSGRIELNITRNIAEMCSHSGSCDNDVNAAMEIPSIRRQLNKIDPVVLANELREYGAWDDEELKDHSANLARILWIACGDIVENIYTK
jgi:hypothetical protein